MKTGEQSLSKAADALTHWFFHYGWLMLLAAGLWLVASRVARAVFTRLRATSATPQPQSRLSKYALIKLDTLAFVVRWGLVLLLLSVEAYLLLHYLDAVFPAFYQANARWIQSWIGHLKVVGMILLVFLTLQRLARLANEAVLARTRGQHGVPPEEQSLRAHTLLSVLRGVITTVLVVLALLAILAEFGKLSLLTPLLTGAGLAGIAVAFAVQSLLRDFFSGFCILLEDQFSIGDTVKIGDRTGQVEAISLRTTLIRDDSGALHIIPNGEIKFVSNLSAGWATAQVDISLPASYDPDQVLAALRLAAEQLGQDEALRSALLAPPAVLGIESLSASGVLYRVAIKTRPQTQGQVVREFRRRLYHVLHKNGLPVAA